MVRGQWSLVEQETGRVVVARLRVAATLWERTTGLLTMPPLEDDEGLWLEPCTGIHTVGMGYALDLLALGKSGNVVRMIQAVPPLRAWGPFWKARIVVEMRSGLIAKTKVRKDRHYIRCASAAALHNRPANGKNE